MMIIENKFNIQQEVYLKTDKDQCKRIITAMLIKVTGIQYELSCGSSGSWHYEFEISDTADVLTKVE